MCFPAAAAGAGRGRSQTPPAECCGDRAARRPAVHPSGRASVFVHRLGAPRDAARAAGATDVSSLDRNARRALRLQDFVLCKHKCILVTISKLDKLNRQASTFSCWPPFALPPARFRGLPTHVRPNRARVTPRRCLHLVAAAACLWRRCRTRCVRDPPHHRRVPCRHEHAHRRGPPPVNRLAMVSTVPASHVDPGLRISPLLPPPHPLFPHLVRGWCSVYVFSVCCC